MSKKSKKKSSCKNRLENALLATATIELLIKIIELIKELLD